MRAQAALSIVLAAAGGAGCGGATRDATVAPKPAASRDPGPAPAIRGPDGQIALYTMSGQPTTLAAHGAKVTVIALWATFCGPCLEELPHVDALYRKYRGRPDVSVIAINLDDTTDPAMRAHVARLLHRMSIQMPSLLGGLPVMERLTVRDDAGEPKLALPLLAVVDAAFRIHRRFGFMRGQSRDQYLSEKAALVESALRGEEPVNPLPPGFSR
jgi:thiol-disulfide isomerase/thioredoxin